MKSNTNEIQSLPHFDRNFWNVSNKEFFLNWILTIFEKIEKLRGIKTPTDRIEAIIEYLFDNTNPLFWTEKKMKIIEKWLLIDEWNNYKNKIQISDFTLQNRTNATLDENYILSDWNKEIKKIHNHYFEIVEKLTNKLEKLSKNTENNTQELELTKKNNDLIVKNLTLMSEIEDYKIKIEKLEIQLSRFNGNGKI